MSKVYFIAIKDKSSIAEQIKATSSIMENAGFDRVMKNRDKVAVKIHVGENNNDTHVAPEIIKAICSRIKRNGAYPFLTETSTLYKGRRSNAIDHLNHAYAHGFTPQNVGAPFIMADGLLGNTELNVQIPGKIFKQVNIAREIAVADVLVAVTHVTGHLHAGLGAGIKNLGMGLASRIGKMRQHSGIKPYIDNDKCTFCKSCIRWCPEECIVEQEAVAFILKEKCIGCGECLAVCKFDAVQYNWGTGSAEMQRKMVEHALGVVYPRPAQLFFLHFLVNMTKDCDCMSYKQQKIMPDIGILAGIDVVALDQATLDLTAEAGGEDIGKRSFPHLDPQVQLAHAEEIGLGSRQYELIKVGE